MRCIVTTTIYPPSEATLKFCQKKDWTFIIVGDLKTPHEDYFKLTKNYPNVKYLDPDYQKKAFPELSEATGWNTIQRRNIGFAYAYNMGAEIIASVDDDNIPYKEWGENLYLDKSFEVQVDLYSAFGIAFDPLSVTNQKHLWHRGYPIEFVPFRDSVEYKGKIFRKALVQADLWDGDPDIDAIARLTHRSIVKFDVTEPYCSDMISPFNSQNTFLSHIVMPYYCMIPHVGRMDDIWASYILQYHFPKSVIYGPASVYQKRNPQDLIVNLENEILGYKQTASLIADLPNYEKYLPAKAVEYIKIYRKCLI